MNEKYFNNTKQNIFDFKTILYFHFRMTLTFSNKTDWISILQNSVSRNIKFLINFRNYAQKLIRKIAKFTIYKKSEELKSQKVTLSCFSILESSLQVDETVWTLIILK